MYFVWCSKLIFFVLGSICLAALVRGTTKIGQDDVIASGFADMFTPVQAGNPVIGRKPAFEMRFDWSHSLMDMAFSWCLKYKDRRLV